MKSLFALVGFMALCGLAPNAHAQATGNTTIQPDCLIPFTFTAAGNSPTASVANAQNDNRTRGCSAWTLEYQNTGSAPLTGVTVTLQSGCSTSTTVTYGTFAGVIPTMPSGNANPIVSDAGGQLTATNGTACISWVRVNVAATGSGTLTGVLYGFRNSSAAVNGGGGGGGGTCPQGPTGSVQYSDGTDCQGSASFIWDNADLLAKIGGSPITPFAGLYVASNFALGSGAELTSPSYVTSYLGSSASIGQHSELLSVNSNFGSDYLTGRMLASTWQNTDTDGGDFAVVYDNFFMTSVPASSKPTGEIDQVFHALVFDNIADAGGVSYGGGTSLLAYTQASSGISTGARLVSVDANILALGNASVPLAIGLLSSIVTEQNTTANIDEAHAILARVLPEVGTTIGDLNIITARVQNQGGTVTNLRGLNIEDITGATNNWAIKTGLGLVLWGDREQESTIAFASLPAVTQQMEYCSDCTVTSGIDNTCAGSGTGAHFEVINGVKKCWQ